MKNKLIIFSHHYVDDIVIERFNNLKNLNPTWDIVSIGFDGYNLIPNSLVINKEKYPTNKAINYYVLNKSIDWFDCDLFAYDAYLQMPTYDEYFLYEYDTICNVPIESFFNTNVDFFGNRICDPSSEDWEWIKLYRKHNSHHIKFSALYAYGQSTCVYFKNYILGKCVNEVLTNKHLYDNMFCEVRGGTLVSKFTTLKKGREDIQKYISWTSDDIAIDLNQNYFYHPIKTIV
jgi:hypothetical protein